MNNIKKQVSAYRPYDEREAVDKEFYMRCLETFPDILTRNNIICHATASCWVVNRTHDKALMLFHNINQMWMWPGGHADGEDNLSAVSLREVQEETSLSSVRLVDNRPFSLEILTVPPHVRRGKLVASHLHLNCSFLLEADEGEPFKVKPDENSAIKWMPFSNIISAIDHREMSPHYRKLIEKTNHLFRQK